MVETPLLEKREPQEGLMRVERSHEITSAPAQRHSAQRASHPIYELPDPRSENLLTVHMQKVPTEAEAKQILRCRGVPKLSNLQTGSAEEKISAMTYLQFAYIPTDQAARFARKITAEVRKSLLLRNPEDPRYSKFFHGQANVMRGGRLIAMPSFLHSLQGASFILAGPSGAGKTALIQRLRALIGQGHTVIRGSGVAPPEMFFLPMLVIRWPDCGTLEGLLANFREAIIGEIGSSATSEDVFSNFNGRNARNAAIATAIFLNLGLFVLDGGCMRSLREEHREILDFVSTLQEYSGIPTLLSCTYPMLQAVTRNGSKGANLGAAHAEYLDLIPPGERWKSYCKFFWSCGLFEQDIPMPDYLPSLIWKVSQGNMRILVQAFNGIHHALLERPALLESGYLKEQDAAPILDLRLRQFVEPLRVMGLSQILLQEKEEIPSSDLWIHGDYLPYEAFNKTPSGIFEQKMKNGLLAARRASIPKK